jgi:hypothetical protein
MAFGKPGTPDSAKLSPERQLTKLREQNRSGGGGGGSRGGARVPIDPGVQPPAHKTREEEEQRGRGITLELTPDANDKDMEELLSILRTKGFEAALEELDSLNNPHLEDDFHRLLVQYKREGHPIPGLDPHDPLAKALDFVLLEVQVPEAAGDKPGSTVKDICAKMEQLYLALIPFVSLPEPIFFKDYRRRKVVHREHFTMELAVSHVGEHAVFYIAIPQKKRALLRSRFLLRFRAPASPRRKMITISSTSLAQPRSLMGSISALPPYPSKLRRTLRMTL